MLDCWPRAKIMCQAWNFETVSTGEALGVSSSTTLPN